MIIVDGREIKFKNEIREESVKTIIDTIEKEFLSDDALQEILFKCVICAINSKVKEKKCTSKNSKEST